MHEHLGLLLRLHAHRRWRGRKLHSVPRAAPSSLCAPANTAPARVQPTVFRVTVNDTNPIWFYCSQPALGGHCAHGMVGVINEPASGPDTLAAYAAHAKSTTSANVTNPSVIGGGVFAANLNASTPSSTMASAVSTSATGTSTGTGTGSPSTSPTSGAAGVGASAWMEMLGFGAVLGGWAALAL